MNSLSQLNTYSALSVAYDDQGTGAQTLADRYQINGLLDTAQPVLKNIEKICSAAGSWLSYDIHDGRWGVVINNSGTSIASFSDSNIIGNINISGTGLTDLYNSVKVEFPHRDLKDSADFVTIEIPDGDRNSNEEDNSLQLTYDIINEPVQAQLLGFIELKQSRIDKVIKFQCDYSLFNLKAGDIIDVTNTRLAFTNKRFRIISITEIADTEALKMDITALEYDPNVYSVADLFRYTRTDSNGIISIGSIGVPGTPQVSKFEADSRPRINVSSLAPTGIVEGMEFWITNDVNIPNDANRSYRLIATQRPTAPNFTSGESVVLEYDALASQDFFVKTRGFNATTTGPFSTPSGLILYRPKQITDGIGPDTGVFDETGTLITAFAASLLMNKVSDLLLGAVSSGSIFSSVFDLFKDETGVDLVGQASSGTLVVASNLEVADEGTTVTPTTSRINFVGNGVTATASGDVVTVTINATTGTTGGGSTGTTTSTTTGTTTTSVLLLSRAGVFPGDIGGFDPSYLDTPTGSTTGPFYVRYAGGARGSLYGPLSLGTGNIELYQSDGTLISTVAAGSCSVDLDLLSIPFPDREQGTDYFVLMDQGVVSYCNYVSPSITSPEIWNFQVVTFDSPSPVITGNTASVATIVTATAVSYTPTGTEVGRNDFITVSYDQGVKAGSGNFQIREYVSDSVVATIAVSSTNTVGSSVSLGSVSFGQPLTRYYITSDAGAVLLNELDCFAPSTPAQAITKADNFEFTMVPALQAIAVNVRTTPFEGNTQKTNKRTYVGLQFNRSIQRGDSGSISLYKQGGTLVQTFNIASSFALNKSSNIISISGDLIFLNPTKALEQGQSYYLTGTPQSIKDFKGFGWGGETSPTAFTFRVDPGPEAVVADINNDSDTIVMNFDRTIGSGPGTIQVYDELGNFVTEISSDDPSITYS
jgi:hypothetical protein